MMENADSAMKPNSLGQSRNRVFGLIPTISTASGAGHHAGKQPPRKGDCFQPEIVREMCPARVMWPIKPRCV